MTDEHLNVEKRALEVGHLFTTSIVSRKDSRELEAELRIKEADALHARHKELALLSATLVALLILLVLCARLVWAKGLTAEEGKLAFGTLTTIIGTLLGYLTGKSSK